MKLKCLVMAVCGAALGLMLAGCSGGGNSSSSAITLAQGSDPVVNSAVSSAASMGGESESLIMMTVDEAIARFKTIDPAALGLSGEDMSAYEVYPTEKAVPVDGIPCLKITVYEESSVGTNQPEGTFLMARDGTAMYRLEDNEVTKLEIG